MSVLITGMEMPKEGSWATVRIYPDGTCAVPNWQGDCTFIQGAQAVHVPPHGRLIDADALLNDKGVGTQIAGWGKMYHETAIEYAPTIIPAEEGE